VALPKEFWKVVSCLDDEGNLKAYAFILSQKGLIRAAPEEEFEVGPYEPFQTKLRELERRTGLDFGKLVDSDALETEGAEEAFEADLGEAVRIGSLSDIVL